MKDTIHNCDFNSVTCKSYIVTKLYIHINYIYIYIYTGDGFLIHIVLHKPSATNKYTHFSYFSAEDCNLTLGTGFPTPHVLLYAFPSHRGVR